MPIYEFECPVHGTFERIFSLLEWKEIMARFGDGTLCQIQDEDGLHCDTFAERIWSLPARTDLGAPTRVFINNRTGEMFTPIGKYDQAPRGYHEKELKDSFQRNKFEKEYQTRLDATNEIVTHELESQKAEITKRRHDDIKAKMNSIQREIDPATGKEIEYTLDHRDKEVLKKAMNRTKKKKFRPRTSDFKFAVNHNNSGNLNEVS